MTKRKKFERLLLSSVSNLAMSFADAYIEKNVELRASAGLKVTVIRRQIGDCCKWCRNLAGIYTADQLPDDIYKRHANCRCMVTYKTEKVYTDAWSKKQFETQKAARLEREKELKAEAAEREARQKIERLEYDRKVRESHSKENRQRQRQKMLAKEKEILLEMETSNKRRKKAVQETLIDKKQIDSSQYRRQFNKLGEKPEITRIIYQRTKEILEHRSGTEYEDLIFIDSGSGKIEINKNPNDKLTCEPNEKMKKMLADSKEFNIIAVHNHPYGSPPSMGDIRALIKRKYKYGIIAGHNGHIYKYKAKNTYNSANVKIYIDRLSRQYYNNEEDKEIVKTLEELKKAGVTIEKI